MYSHLRSCENLIAIEVIVYAAHDNKINGCVRESGLVLNLNRPYAYNCLIN